MRIQIMLLCLLAGLMFWIIGCSGGNSLTGPGAIQGIGNPGTVKLLVADAPLDGISAVNVTITRIDLLYDGVEDSNAIADPVATASTAGTDTEVENDDPISPENDDATPPDSDDIFVTVFSGEKDVDLLAMANKPLEELATLASPLPSGHYKQVRLYLKDGGSVVLADSSTVPLKVPSNMLRLHLDLFVNPDETVEVLLDFDLAAQNSLNLVSTGGKERYILTPMLHIDKVKDTGSITGTLHAASGIAENATVAVTATEYNRSTIVEMEGTTDRTGHLRMNGLPIGTYTINGTVDYDGTTTTFTQDVTIESKGVFDIGTIELTVPTTP